MTKSLIKITECLFTCTITSSCSHVRYIHVSLRFHANTAVMFESMHVYDIVCCMRYFVGSWKEKGATKVKVVRFSKPLYQKYPTRKISILTCRCLQRLIDIY